MCVLVKKKTENERVRRRATVRREKKENEWWGIMLAGLKLDGTPRSQNLAELDLHGMGQDHHIYNLLKYALIPKPSGY